MTIRRRSFPVCRLVQRSSFPKAGCCQYSPDTGRVRPPLARRRAMHTVAVHVGTAGCRLRTSSTETRTPNPQRTMKPTDLSANMLFQIRWLVDRLHVGASDAAVVREFATRSGIGRSRPGLPRKAIFTRAERKATYRAALIMHAQNRDLYRHVMGAIA